MKTYLVIETFTDFGKAAYIETVSASENLLRYKKQDGKIVSISAYTRLNKAKKQVDFLNELYNINNQ